MAVMSKHVKKEDRPEVPPEVQDEFLVDLAPLKEAAQAALPVTLLPGAWQDDVPAKPPFTEVFDPVAAIHPDDTNDSSRNVPEIQPIPTPVRLNESFRVGARAP